MSRRFGRFLYSNIFSLWLIGSNLFAWSVLEKLTAGKIHANDKTSWYWVVELLEHSVLWLIDLGPRNRGFYTGPIELPRIHPILKGMSGLWSSAEALHIEKASKTAMFNRRPMGSPILNISNRIFCSDFISKFFEIKSLPKDHTGANVSLAKFQSRSNLLSRWPVLFLFFCQFSLPSSLCYEQNFFQSIFAILYAIFSIDFLHKKNTKR